MACAKWPDTGIVLGCFGFINETAPGGGIHRDPGESTPLLHGGYHRWTFAEWNGQKQFDENLLTGEAPDTDPKKQTPPSDWQGVNAYPPNSPPPNNKGFPFWRGSGGDLYIEAGVMKPSRVGSLGGGGISPPGFRKTSTRTEQGGVSGLGTSISVSETKVHGQVDFLDINGDRFPDSVSGGRILLNNGCGSVGALEKVTKPTSSTKRRSRPG